MRTRTILLAALLLPVAFAWGQDEGQDPAIQQVLDRIDRVERGQARGSEGQEESGGKYDRFWGGKVFNASMIILPSDEKVVQGLDRLAAFVRGSLWADASRTVQELLKTYPHRVMQIRRDPGLFIGVKAWCEATLRASPKLLAAYRETYNDRTRVAMDRALQRADMKTLTQLAHSYALTTPGRDLLARLSLLQAEAGNFEDANFFVRRLLTLYPEDPAVATDLIPRQAMVLARLGDLVALRQLEAEVSKRGLDGAEINVSGRAARLGGFIRRKIHAVEAVANPGNDYSRLTDHFEAQPGEIIRSTMKWPVIPPSSLTSR